MMNKEDLELKRTQLLEELNEVEDMLGQVYCQEDQRSISILKEHGFVKESQDKYVKETDNEDRILVHIGYDDCWVEIGDKNLVKFYSSYVNDLDSFLTNLKIIGSDVVLELKATIHRLETDGQIDDSYVEEWFGKVYDMYQYVESVKIDGLEVRKQFS